MEQAARVKEIKHLHRKRTQKCLFSEIGLKTVKRMVKENIYGRKVFCRIDPRLAVNRKKEELLKRYYTRNDIFINQ
jgi:hypothetical protein